MDKDHLIGVMEEMKARSLMGELSSSDKVFIQEHYERITFRMFTGTSCSRCYNDAFIEMYTTLKKYGLRDMSNYKLKSGIVLKSAKFPEVVTNNNITDELAIKWLKDNPNRVNFFEKLPENIKELLDQPEEVKIVFVAPMNPETNKPFSPASKAYKEAKAIFDKEQAEKE